MSKKILANKFLLEVKHRIATIILLHITFFVFHHVFIIVFTLFANNYSLHFLKI